MADTPSSPQSNQTVSSNGPIVIKSQTGHGIDMHAFSRAMGQKDSSDDVDIPEGEEGESEPKEAKTTSEGIENEEDKEGLQGSEEAKEVKEDTGETSDLEKISVKDGKGFVAKVGDKEFKLPENLTIMHKVDGKLQEINLKEALNREAGELTVHQRLTKLDQLEKQIKSESSQIQEQVGRYENLIQQVVAANESGKPEVALALIGEIQGKSPGQVWKDLFVKALEWSKHFEEQGKTMQEMEAYFARIDNEWYRKQIEKSKKTTESTQNFNNFLRLSEEARASEGLSQEEMTLAIEEIVEYNKKQDGSFLRGKSDSELVDLACEHALNKKHTGMVNQALSELGSDFVNDDSLKKKLLDVTNPHEWTPEEISNLAKEYKKLSLSEKLKDKAIVNGASPTQGVSVRQKEEKTKPVKVKSVAELRRTFGLGL